MRKIAAWSVFAACIAASVAVLLWVGPSFALASYMRGNHEAAASMWQALAHLGNKDAQFNLGLCYAKGRGVPQNLQSGLYWYERAARNGSADAQFNFAEYLRQGEGVKANQRAALYWHSMAAAQNYAPAQHNLGRMHADGAGTTQDLTVAAMWFRIAIANGSQTAGASLEYFEKEMSPDERKRAQEMATVWLRERK